MQWLRSLLSNAHSRGLEEEHGGIIREVIRAIIKEVESRLTVTSKNEGSDSNSNSVFEFEFEFRVQNSNQKLKNIIEA